MIYDYSNVVGWSDHIDGGLFNLDQLFIPINIKDKHWIFMCVQFESKTIKIYNSFGSPNPHHRKYLWAMQTYLYNEEFKDVAHEARHFDVWKHTCKTQDKSKHSPKQENTFDCGTFVMISIYLMSRKVQLQRSSYDQYGVSSRQLQPSIAFMPSQANELAPSGSVAQHLTT